MNAKLERFEMRLESDLIDRIDKWRETQRYEPSRSEAVRQLIETGLAGTEKELRPDGFQRMTLWMLSELMKRSDDEYDAKTTKLIQGAIFGGHFWALDWEMQGVLHSNIDKREDVTFVVDTLVMWREIEVSYAGLTTAEKDALEERLPGFGRDPQFIGFDGNNETDLMSIASFLIETMGRFSEFANRSLNSHMPKAARYSSMLRVFNTFPKSWSAGPLTVDQLAKLLARE